VSSIFTFCLAVYANAHFRPPCKSCRSSSLLSSQLYTLFDECLTLSLSSVDMFLRGSRG
jgi:hypothetical protein